MRQLFHWLEMRLRAIQAHALRFFIGLERGLCDSGHMPPVFTKLFGAYKSFSGAFKKVLYTAHKMWYSSVTGALAKLGSRMTGSHEARGSNPLCSTER